VPTFELFFDLVHILTLTQITQLMAQCQSSHTQIKSRVLLKAHTAVAGLEFKCPGSQLLSGYLANSAHDIRIITGANITEVRDGGAVSTIVYEKDRPTLSKPAPYCPPADADP
jgi:hypothetical protein